MEEKSAIKVAFSLIAFWIVLLLAFWGGVAYVAWHFISKYW